MKTYLLIDNQDQFKLPVIEGSIKEISKFLGIKKSRAYELVINEDKEVSNNKHYIIKVEV